MTVSRWRLFQQPDVQRRAFKTSVMVGTILAAINYGDILLANEMTSLHWLKLAITYLVPYGVSSWASVQALFAEKYRQ